MHIFLIIINFRYSYSNNKMSLYFMKIFEHGKSLNDLLPSNLLSDLEIDTNEASSLTEESLIDVRV